ncbi:MAG: reverse transcriptase family protein [Bacteroidia bacterium]
MIIRSKKHLTQILGISWEKLVEVTDNIDRYYYKDAKQKTYKDGSPKRHGVSGKIKWRVLHPSINDLKTIQKRIHHRILKKLDYPTYMMGGIKKRDSVLNARPHMGKKDKLLTDMSNYYPSVKNKWVYHGLIAYGFSPDIASILTKLTTFKGYVPQGAPTSSDVANIAFKNLIGDQLNEFCVENGITMTLYVDDITFSSQKDFEHLTPLLLKMITDAGLYYSQRKTGYTRSKNVIITGVKTGNNQLNAPDDFVENKLKKPENFNENQRKGHKNRFERIRRISKQKFNALGLFF